MNAPEFARLTADGIPPVDVEVLRKAIAVVRHSAEQKATATPEPDIWTLFPATVVIRAALALDRAYNGQVREELLVYAATTPLKRPAEDIR